MIEILITIFTNVPENIDEKTAEQLYSRLVFCVINKLSDLEIKQIILNEFDIYLYSEEILTFRKFWFDMVFEEFITHYLQKYGVINFVNEHPVVVGVSAFLIIVGALYIYINYFEKNDDNNTTSDNP